MYDWIKSCNNEKIIEKYIQTFIYENDYRSCAIQNRSVRIYASDFLIESNQESFSEIFSRLLSKKNNCFYIIWMLSCIYKDSFFDTANIGVIPRDNLIQLLLKQKEEMVNDCLVYIKDLSLTDFWDLMIFDETFTWSYILTHEDDLDGKRICYYAEQSGR